MVRVLRAAEVGRIAVRHAAVAVFAVIPIAAAHAAVGLAVGHRAALRRPGRIVRRTIGVVVAPIPIVDELPDVAGHVVQAVSVRAIGGLEGFLGARPAEVGLALQFAVEKSNRRGPRLRAGAERIVGFRPVGLGGIGVIAPREIAIGFLLCRRGPRIPTPLRSAGGSRSC